MLTNLERIHGTTRRALLAAFFAGSLAATAQPVMVPLPGGTYQMGDHAGFVDPSHPSDEVPIHTVTISPFRIAKTDVRLASSGKTNFVLSG